MKLFELFNKTAQYHLHAISDGWEASFNINSPKYGDIVYNANFELSSPSSDQASAIYQEQFGVQDWRDVESTEAAWAAHPAYVVEFLIANATQLGISSFGVSGTGNASMVLSTVIAITQEIVQRSVPVELVFTAAEQSRQKLYNRLIPILSKSIGFKDVSTTKGLYILVNLALINKQ